MSGLFDVGTPIPATPPLHGLQASVPETREPSRWQLGVTLCPENCVEISGWDPNCAAWPDGVKPDKSEATTNQDCYDVLPFVLESPFECASAGFRTVDYSGRARRQLEAATSKGLEYELWTGELQGDNPHLTTGATVIGAAAAFPLRQGLSLLGQALSNCAHGGRGTIHAPTFIVDNWMDDGNLIQAEGPRLVTGNRGDVVISGSGYPGTGPDGIAPGPNQSWVYATGPIQYRLDEVVVYPDTLNEAMDSRRNRIEYRAERLAMVNFDPCCHFAILVELGSSPVVS